MRGSALPGLVLPLLFVGSGCWWQARDLACETDADCPFALVCDPSLTHEATGLYACAEVAADDDDSAPADDDDSAQGDDDDSALPQGPVEVVGTGFFDTIEQGVNAAPDGATIRLAAGCYDEAVLIDKPLTLRGDSAATTVITGGGAATAMSVQGVTAGGVSVESLEVRVPRDAPTTARALWVFESGDTTIHDAVLGFEPALQSDAEADACARFALPDQTTGDCDSGTLGVEVSQSTLVLSETQILCVGFSSDAGGTGIVAQGSLLTLTQARVDAVGSFGVRTVDTSLSINQLDIAGVNRESDAQDGEPNGSAVVVEAGSGDVVIDGLTVENGVYVGLWVETPTASVTDSLFTGFSYGIYMPDGAATAAGQHLNIADSTFIDLREEAVWAAASTTIVGSDFRIEGLPAPSEGGTANAGLRLLGAGTVHEVSGNTFDGFADHVLRFAGDEEDGNIASVIAEENLITNVVAGNAIDLLRVDAATLRDNVIDGVDHAYNDSSSSPGSISNGFGVYCFAVGDCELEGNSVTAAEFAGYVIQDSAFSSLDDTAGAGFSRGFHIQGSQGSLTNPTITDQRGYGVLAFDSTVEGTGGTFTDTVRAPPIADIDGHDDPLPGDLDFSQGGVSLFATGQDAPTSLSWTGGEFNGAASSAVLTSDAQVQLTDNRFVNAGFVDGSGYFPSSGVAIAGNDPQALTGPVFTDNVMYGGEGAFGLYIADAGAPTIQGNTFCAGTAAGVYLNGAGGALIEDNLIGTTDDPAEVACDSLDWVSGLHINRADPSSADDAITLRDLTIAAPEMHFGLYLVGLGTSTIEDVAITGASEAGISARMTLPAGLALDHDSDGSSPYLGDCDDTDPSVGGFGAVEVPNDGLDNDCDGVTDSGDSTDDSDGDGYSIADGDCNDTDTAINPGMVEVVDNLRDDNCDGWADFDGEYDWPELNLRGTTIDGAEAGLLLSGVTANLLDPVADGDPVNAITNIGGVGVTVEDWTWPGTPLQRAGALDIGAQTVLGPTGSHCVSLASANTTTALTGTTLTSCGGHGVESSAGGGVTLIGVDIVSPTLSGVYAASGTVLATDLWVFDASGAAVSIAGAAADVTLWDLEAAGGVVGVEQLAGALVLDGFTSSGTSGSALVMAGGTASLDGLDVLGAGQHGLLLSGGVVTSLGGSVGTVVNDGVHVSGSADVSAADLLLGAAEGHGLSVSGGAIDWSLGSITGPLLAGVMVSGGIATLEDVAVSDTGDVGLWVTDGQLAILGGSVQGAGAAGVLGTGGTLTMQGLEVSGAADNGVQVEGTVIAALLDGTLVDNGGFGLRCDGGSADPTASTATLSPCEAQVSGNLEGEFELVNGCELLTVCVEIP